MTMLICLLTAVFMAILDVAVANIALPLVQSTLHASGPQLQLVTVAYVAAYALLLIVCARLGKMLGYRRVFMSGLILFTLASLACGTAISPAMLIASRLVQGIGAALMMPQVLSLIQRRFDGADRARALSWYAAVIACGAIVGQIVGGIVVNANLFGMSWRPVFLINVPIGLVLMLFCRRLLPQDGPAKPQWRQLDVWGVLLLSVTLASFIVPNMIGGVWAWLFGVVSLIFAAILLRHERREEVLGRPPLLPRALFGESRFVAGVSAILIAMAGYGGMLFLLTIFIQDGLHQSALVAGLAFLPSAVAFGTVSLTWRRLPERFHRVLAPVGLAIVAVAFFALAASMQQQAVSVGMELAIFGFGLGMGLAFSPLFAQVLAIVPPVNAADASGILTTANQLGQTLGVTMYGALLLNNTAATTALVMGVGSLAAGLLATFALRCTA